MLKMVRIRGRTRLDIKAHIDGCGIADLVDVFEGRDPIFAIRFCSCISLLRMGVEA
jgi:hypothetical protein